MNDYVMKNVICDDDPDDRNSLAEMTRRIAAQEKIGCELEVYDSSTALLQAIAEGAAFHTLLLDVVMPEMDGMQLAAALRQQQNNTSIVFVSSNREMAMLGYEVAASRFLSKPAQEDKLREALRYCELELKTGAVLPVSKYRQNATRDKLMNYLEG